MLYQYSDFTFPFLIILGIVLGVFIIIKKFKKLPIDKFSFDRLLVILALAGGLFYIGSRLFDDLFHYLNGEINHKGGITFMGGMITAVSVFVVCFLVFLKPIRKMFFKITNILVIGIVLGHAIGRIGCFLSGCCYGKPTESFIGVTFPGTYEIKQASGVDAYYIYLYGSDAYEDLFTQKVNQIVEEKGIIRLNNYYYLDEETAKTIGIEADNYAKTTKLIPTQILESLFLFILFGVLLIIPKFQTSTYLIGYGIFRFINEILRSDNRGSVLLGISPSQLLSILIVLIGIGLLVLNIILGKKDQKQNEEVKEIVE